MNWRGLIGLKLILKTTKSAWTYLRREFEGSIVSFLVVILVGNLSLFFFGGHFAETIRATVLTG